MQIQWNTSLVKPVALTTRHSARVKTGYTLSPAIHAVAAAAWLPSKPGLQPRLASVRRCRLRSVPPRPVFLVIIYLIQEFGRGVCTRGMTLCYYQRSLYTVCIGDWIGWLDGMEWFGGSGFREAVGQAEDRRLGICDSSVDWKSFVIWSTLYTNLSAFFLENFIKLKYQIRPPPFFHPSTFPDLESYRRLSCSAHIFHGTRKICMMYYWVWEGGIIFIRIVVPNDMITFFCLSKLVGF